MFEIPVGRKMPQLTLHNPEANNVANILRFRLKCREQGKTGIIMQPFGQGFWIDTEGNYLDGKIPTAELELAQVLTELDGLVVGGNAPNNPAS
jgi:hypothetical protein